MGVCGVVSLAADSAGIVDWCIQALGGDHHCIASGGGGGGGGGGGCDCDAGGWDSVRMVSLLFGCGFATDQENGGQ